MRIFVISFILILGNLSLFSQDQQSAKTIEEDLLFYGDVMMNGYEASTRQRASQVFEKLFDEYISKNNPITKETTFSKYISVVPSPEEVFTLVTWIIKLEDGGYDYKGYILTDNIYTKLKRTSSLSAESAYETSSTDDWYGCWYNKIMQHSKDVYLIFGIDKKGEFESQRLIDVITINKDNDITFGAPIFEDRESLDTYLNRLIISYSADASVTLDYHPGLDMILHDHLQQRMGQMPGQGPTNIPDGTYEGYEKKGDKWMYKEKIYSHTYEEDNPPRPKPVFNDSEKGKSRKSR